MMLDYLLLLLAAFLLAVMFGLNKLYQKRAGTSLAAGLRFNAIVGVMTAALFWAMGGFSLDFSLYSLLLAAGVAVFGMAYTLLGFRILRAGSMATYSLFLMVGGMTVPFVCGLIFWGEPFSVLRTVGLCLLIGAVALSNISGKRDTRMAFPILLMCVAVFFLNGMTSVCSKLHQIEAVRETVASTQFVVLVGLSKSALSLITLPFVRERTAEAPTQKKAASPWLSLLPMIALIALVDGLSYFLQLKGAQSLPATVLYPFVTGGSMVFSTLVGILAFRERPSKMTLLSVAISVLATLMFL